MFPRVFASLVLFALSLQLPAQTTTPPPSSTVPGQIATAHNVFLSNAGASHNFPVDATSAYNQVYAALQGWGRYQLVNSPAQADLIFTLRDVAPTSVVGSGDDTYSYTTPAYQITITDPKTNVTLWTLTSPVIVAGNRSARERWQQISLTNLISRLKVLTGETLDATESADLTTYPANHFKRNILIAGVGFAALSAGSYFLVHHLYENGLADQKAQQDAFCKANNIPLSECAGG
jgi:hypothetical protein